MKPTQTLTSFSVTLALLAAPASAQMLLKESDGAQAGEHFGQALCRIDDWDKDGYDEYAVGAPFWDFPGNPDAGRVRIFSGRTGHHLTSIGPMFSGEAFGFSIDRLDDLNGDGVDELIVGAPSTTTTAQGPAACT